MPRAGAGRRAPKPAAKQGEEGKKFLERPAAILALVGALITVIAGGIGLMSTLREERADYRMTVQVWDVESDAKHAIVASEVFEGSGGTDLPPESKMEAVDEWLRDQLSSAYGYDETAADVTIDMPSDLSSDLVQITIDPSIRARAYYSFSTPTGKVRRVLDERQLSEALEAARLTAFDLEIEALGFKPETLGFELGRAETKRIKLRAAPISIGVEEFDGSANSVAERLGDHLRGPRINIKDPETLAILRDRIAKEQAAIDANPTVQMGLRTSLGVDLILTGSYQKLHGE